MQKDGCVRNFAWLVGIERKLRSYVDVPLTHIVDIYEGSHASTGFDPRVELEVKLVFLELCMPSSPRSNVVDDATSAYQGFFLTHDMICL